MTKEQALDLWNDLHPLPAEISRYKFAGESGLTYSVSVNAHEMSGPELEIVLKAATARDLELHVRAINEYPEIVFYKKK